jgi:hypothetical protein
VGLLDALGLTGGCGLVGAACQSGPLDYFLPGVTRRALGGLEIDSWIDQGFTWNPDNPANRFNGPLTFNDRSNEYMMNQFYLAVARNVDPQCDRWQIGGRADLLYGTDYFFTMADGLETRSDGSPHWNSGEGPRGAGAALYGLAMPQLYAEVMAPVGNGLSVKMGHFYSILGYESVMAPENFFYSHSYVKQYGEPFTHTGLLATYHYSPCLKIEGGFTRGWDNWEDPNDSLGFLGGFTWTSMNKKTSVALNLTTSAEDPNGNNERSVYSLVVQRRISPRLRYVFQHDFGIEEAAAIDANFQLETARWYGINQYLFYTVSRSLDLGMRIEWFRDQNNARVLGQPIARIVGGGNYVELTFGANWKPTDYFIFRPEIRYDTSDVNAPALGLEGMFDDFTDDDQLTLALDFITVF